MDEKLLADFSTQPSASAGVIDQAELDLTCTLPLDYRSFLLRTNGGEGFIGENYLILWAAEELAVFNKEYQVQDYAPGLILFASDGGGEGFAFDTRSQDLPIVKVPFIGMSLNDAEGVAPTFDDFLNWLAQ